MARTATTIRRSFCIGCLGALALVPALQAQTQTPPSAPQHQMGMMATCQAITADLKAGDAKLDDLIAKMNAATGQAKIEQMAAVLTELVAQRKTMHGRMMSMNPERPSDAPPAARPQMRHEAHH